MSRRPRSISATSSKSPSLLRRLNAERGTTMIVSTHDLNLAAALCEQMVLLKEGRVVAQGPTADTLTPANIRLLYDVDADVQFHDRAGHLTVVPIARVALTRPRRFIGVPPSGSGCSGRSRASARWRLPPCLLAPLVGSTPISLAHGVRPLDPVRRQHRRADLLRRPAAARARGRAGRQQPGAGRRRVSGAAQKPAGLTRYARRLGRRVARRDDGDHLRRRSSRCSACRRCRWRASPARWARCPSSTGCRRRDGAARRRWCSCSAG